ncbi:Tetratricopeptide repeat protein [Pseudoruegeria aquimaris]|uniref:Tetratricopeptide repeat protein n=1 Tax=Pseudoruegeria aquimaris TaxID=393663 RepID=A0A1Y5SCT9_9RHOB|nr:tetratricopeptide repeat protein [Pseudoruegeria aquimaris]SLN37480.1 Tetratricopeptide repeat protein [Pseudoruegeria aquimaris]
MTSRHLLISILLGSLAACAPTGGENDSAPGPYAPPVDRAADSVDGLIVGHRLMEAGEYELALKSYYRAAAETGVTPDLLSALGSANLRLGRLGQAERLLRQAVERDPSFVPAWNNLGVTLMEMGQFGEAKEMFRRAYALDSGESDAIRENFRISAEKVKKPGYGAENNNEFALMRRGSNEYLILHAP